jgi:mono/diheme cytochrome c family protein
MKPLLALVALPVWAVILASCETSLKTAPPVTAAFVRASDRKDSELGELEAGRKLFLNRCIACHALPEVAHYDAGRIPGIVGWMSERAHLTSAKKDQVTKYLLAVRSQ